MDEWLGLGLLAVVTLGAASILVTTLTHGSGPVPTQPQVVDAVGRLLGEVTGELHELGAGWGNLAFALARRFPAARVVAWEVSPVPFAFCWLRQRLLGPANLEARLGNFLERPLGSASAVTCYLHRDAMAQLAVKLRAELQPGAVVVTNTFALPGWEPEATETLRDLFATRVMRYRR